MKKIFVLLLSFIISINTLIPVFAETNFHDVDSKSWYHDTVIKLTNMGAITGYSNGEFKPEEKITNSEFIKIVVATLIGDEQKSSSHWAESYMNTAQIKGLILPDEFTKTSWDKLILRQDMAKIMARASEFVLNEDIIENTDEFTNKIADWSETCGACKPYIAQAYAKGLIAGYTDGSFQGNKTATRAEAATMVVRLIDKDYRISYYSGVPFVKATDINENGVMRINAAEKFMMYTVEHMKFYKENGKYFVSVEYPDLPDGFENTLRIEGYFDTSDSILLTSRPVKKDDYRKIPNNGEFFREIHMKNAKDISYFQVNTSIIKKGQSTFDYNKLRSGYIYISYEYKNKLGLIFSDSKKETKYINYNFVNIFKW